MSAVRCCTVVTESALPIKQKGDSMKNLIVDRFEGVYAICEDGEKKFFAIELSELPKEVHEGDVLEIGDDGTLSVNAEKTAERRSFIRQKQNSLWEP